MNTALLFLPEFTCEMEAARVLLAAIPEEHWRFSPHPKSFDLGSLATHIARIPTWVKIMMTSEFFDRDAPQADPGAHPFPERLVELLAYFDANAAEAREALETASEESWARPWSLKKGETTIFTLPRMSVYRTMVMNHLIHHRGQLTVYLRLLEQPLPATYGTSADTQ